MVLCIRNYIRANGAQQRESRDRSGEERRGGRLIHIGLKVGEEELTDYSNFVYTIDFHSNELQGTDYFVFSKQ